MPATALQPSDTKTRFGTHQQFFVTGVQVDRTSLAQVTVEMQVSDEGLNNFSKDFLTLTYGLGVAGEAGIADLLEIPEDAPEDICIGISRRYDSPGSMGIYTYNFEGLLQGRTPFYLYELEFTMNQEPIETHPNFEVFEPIYGPYDPLNRTWQRVPTAKQSSAGGLSANANAAQPVTNPMFGTTSFLSPGAVFRKMYTATKMDSSIFQGIGTKDEPQGLDDFNKDFANWVQTESKRDWLRLSPKINKRGGAYQITEEWMLSGPRGWMEDLYSDTAINHQPGDGGGGSTAPAPIRAPGFPLGP